MHVETRKSGEIVILDLKGRLTAGLGDQILRESVDELLAEGWKRILLNLSEVSFLDSAGLGELVAELKLLSVGEKVQSTLYMSRLLPVFEIYASEAEALAHFGKA
jgi:anti-sigma B factor antagonist